jgi:hypothetical protein
MKDKWMNMGYEDDDLKPYIEPEAEYNDLRRIGIGGIYYNIRTIYRKYLCKYAYRCGYFV